MRGSELLALSKEALARAGQAEAEIVARSVTRGCARFSIGELSQHMSIDEPSVLVRVAVGSRVAEAETSVLELDAVVAAIASAAKAASVVPQTEGFTGFADASGVVAELPRYSARTAACTPEERVALLEPAMKRIRDAGFVSAGMLETSLSSIAVATTRGCSRSFDGTIANYKVWALETPGAGGAAGHGGHMSRDVGALEIARETERAVRMCALGKNPGSLDEGSYDVVMEPHAVSELVEWLAATAFGAAELEQGTSCMKLGERITGEAIDFVEDPLDASETGFAVPFDREGVPRERVELVTRGVAKAVLYDRTLAARMGARSTGSALVSSFDGPSAGASAVHLGAGNAASVDELIGGIDRGLYVCRLHYVNGLLDTRRAVMTGLTRDGCFLVEKGKIVRAVGNMRFTDSFIDALARADGMTRSRAAIPTWWSDAGACVVPAVRFRGLCFNGKSQAPPQLE